MVQLCDLLLLQPQVVFGSDVRLLLALRLPVSGDAFDDLVGVPVAFQAQGSVQVCLGAVLEFS